MPAIHLPSRVCGLVLRRWLLGFAFLFFSFAECTLFAQRANFDDLLRQLPPLQRHAVGTDALVQAGNSKPYEEFAKEKFSGRWFAALLPHSDPPSFSILQRFESWSDFMDFLQERDAIVDVWAYGDPATGTLRRIRAGELAALRKAPYEQPTIL